MKTIYKVITKVPKPLKRIPIKLVNKIRIFNINKLKTPTILIFFVTNNCNLKCKHCFYWKHLNKKTNELSLKDIKKMVSSLKHTLQTLSLTGGEPFLRKDLPEICEIFSKKAKSIGIATNGYNIKQIVNQVKEIRRKIKCRLGIQISLDGLKETHDYIRGVKGSFDHAIKTLRELKKIKDVNVSLATVISNKNYKELKELIKFTNQFNVLHRFQLVRGANSNVYNINQDILSDFDPNKETCSLPPFSKLKEINETINNLTKETDPLLSKLQKRKREYAIKILIEKKKVINCLAGKAGGVIYPNGNVAMCELTKPFANLKDFDFNLFKLWNLDKANNMRRKINACACIHSCNLLDAMRYDTKTLLYLANTK